MLIYAAIKLCKFCKLLSVAMSGNILICLLQHLFSFIYMCGRLKTGLTYVRDCVCSCEDKRNCSVPVTRRNFPLDYACARVTTVLTVQFFCDLGQCLSHACLIQLELCSSPRLAPATCSCHGRQLRECNWKDEQLLQQAWWTYSLLSV